MHTHSASPDISRHKCLIYDGHPSEQLPVVVPLLVNGLRENWIAYEIYLAMLQSRNNLMQVAITESR